MATSKTSQGGGIIILSIAMAALLTLIPLPDTLRYYRPEFVGITLIYWTMAVPHRSGISFAWTIGLLMDVMLGGSLGLLAFSYALIVYFVLQFHLQIRQHPMWQQTLLVFSLILLVQTLFMLAESNNVGWRFCLPAITSMLLWPIIYRVLRSVRRTFHVR